MLTGQFNLRSNFESLTEEITVEQSYEVSCDLVIKDVNNCIPENYGSKFAWGLEPAHDFGSFTKYNYCDHPENGEFKKQVLDKWARHIEPTK